MNRDSGVEWTDATWNPVTGCIRVGPGCDNCYAERLAERFRGTEGHTYEQGFDLRLWPSRLEQPLRWHRPRTIFVNSMSDLFHKDIPRGFLDRVFDTMETAGWHTFQVLTKRSSLMRNYLLRRYGTGSVPDHIWPGVSVEDGAHAGRIGHLREIRSSRRFVSFEPLLGSVGDVCLSDIAWAIVGGESGPGARPMCDEWIAEIHSACRESGTAFFFKQWGAFGSDGVRRSKKANGRTWRNRKWDETPVRGNGRKSENGFQTFPDPRRLSFPGIHGLNE